MKVAITLATYAYFKVTSHYFERVAKEKPCAGETQDLGKNISARKLFSIYFYGIYMNS